MRKYSKLFAGKSKRIPQVRGGMRRAQIPKINDIGRNPTNIGVGGVPNRHGAVYLHIWNGRIQKCKICRQKPEKVTGHKHANWPWWLLYVVMRKIDIHFICICVHII